MTALQWSHATSEIPDAPLEVSRDATPAELSALAAELGVPAVDAVRADYQIRRIGEERYFMTGRVFARVTQACVVTLDPVVQQIEEPVAVEIAGEAGERDSSEEAELPVLDDEREREPLTGGRIEAGRIVFESIAAAIDPYPRKEGAVFDWQDPRSKDGPGAAGPFASLAKLRK